MARQAGLSKLLRRTRDVVVVRGPDVSADFSARLGLPARAEVYDLSTPVPRPREIDTVVLLVRDLPGLRAAATAMVGLGRAHRIGVAFEAEPSRLPMLPHRPDWPAVQSVVGERAGSPFLLLTFTAPAPVRPVIIGLARSTQGDALLTHGWPMLGARRDRPDLWPVGDPVTTVAVAARLHDLSGDSPPDIILNRAGDPIQPDLAAEAHHVLGRSPAVRTVEPELSWAALDALGGAEATAALHARGALSLGGFDSRVLNPIGFDSDVTGAPARLRRAAGGAATDVVLDDRVIATIEPHAVIREDQLTALRPLAGVHLDWDAAAGPQAYARIVVQLAMSGVPLTADHVPEWARILLPSALHDVLQRTCDLDDRLAREERSIRLRRAALAEHTLRAWRRRLAVAQGLPASPPPRISILLPTRRPEMLAFALRQVARQGGVNAELILAAHGFEPDSGLLGRFEAETGIPLTVLLEDRDTPFGDLLNRMVSVSAGDFLLKMDDDDWYSPDFASDLVLAQEYSGADLVGTPPEFTFIEPLWVTTRRHAPTEGFHAPVAGGTMLVERRALREIGGFRSTVRYVDANLQFALTNAGGTIYRAHGLGYVLRRGQAGHTWDPGLGYFVESRHAPLQWRGFRPSPLLEPDPRDLPSRPDGRVGR